MPVTQSIVTIYRATPPNPADVRFAPWMVEWRIEFDPEEEGKYDGNFLTHEEALAHVQAVFDAEHIALSADKPDSVNLPEYIWRDPNGTGWIDAWNGWYETLEQALDEAAAGVGTPWVLTRGQGLISEDERVNAGSVAPAVSDATKAAFLLAADTMNRFALLAHADPGIRPELAAKINDWQQGLSSCDWPILGYDTSDPPAGNPPSATCKHCGRSITFENGSWVDINATGDDAIWRETCDSHDTRTAEHESDEDEPTTDSLKLPTGTLTPAERKHIEVYNGYGVPVDWFVGHRRDNGDIEVLAVGHNRDDDEGRGFVWSLLINGDECATSEAPLGPFTTGLEI